MFAIMFIISLAAAAAHLLFSRERNLDKVLEVLLLYFIGLNFGVGTLIAGIFHLIDGPATAQRIGWAAGSPFQQEVGVADIAFGLVCFLCFFWRGSFWLAAILAQCTFLFGCMLVHIQSRIQQGNAAPFNIGPNIIIADLLFPVLVLVLYAFYRRRSKPTP